MRREAPAPVAKPPAPPAATSSPAADPQAKVAVATEVATLLADEQFDAVAARFTPQLDGVLSAAQLRAGWQQVRARFGELGEVRASADAIDATGERVAVTLAFARGLVELHVAVTDDGRIAGIQIAPAKAALRYQPPAYVDRAAFREADMHVGRGGALPATLTTPVARNASAVVVLVHGSGPHDRDETVGRNAPFKDLAWGLASQGIAVLRYDKRTFVDRQAAVATVDDEVIGDAVSALETLRATPGVRPDCMFVLGHSLGGLLAPRIAARSAAVAGVIIAAAPTRPLPVVVSGQAGYLLSLHDDGRSPEQVAALTQLKADADRLAAMRPDQIAPDATLLGAPGTYWRDLAGYDPAAEARRLAVPLLVLQGGRDYQVTADDFAGWERALRRSPSATLRLYPALDHLFRAGEGASLPSDYELEGHVAAEVVADIAAWVHARCPARP